jgi:hypothetical protein
MPEEHVKVRGERTAAKQKIGTKQAISIMTPILNLPQLQLSRWRRVKTLRRK